MYIYDNTVYHWILLNFLKPVGYFMYTGINIKEFYFLPTQCVYVSCMDLRKNSPYFALQLHLICFYTRDCLLRGTNSIFK